MHNARCPSYISTLSTFTPHGSVAWSRVSSIHWAICSLKQNIVDIVDFFIEIRYITDY